MNIVVTGGNSMVASHFRKWSEKHPDWDIRYANSTDMDLTREHCAKYMLGALCRHGIPDLVVHTAGKVGSMMDNMIKKYDYMHTNMLINFNVIEACRYYEVPKLIAISSTCAYPDVLDDDMYPMSEDQIHLGQPTETSIGYAYSKRMMQLAIDLCNEQYGTKYNYVIPSNIYSEFDKHGGDRMHFLTRLLYNVYLSEKEDLTEIVMQGSGEVYRQYLYGGDLSNVLLRHIEENVDSSYNIAGINYRLSDLADLTLEALGLSDSKRVIFANKIPVGQLRKDVSNRTFEKVFPNFKFSDFQEQVRVVYGALKNKWQSS